MTADPLDDVNQDAILAATDLVHRSGGNLEFGYLHDHVPSDHAGWWAKATYRGAVIHIKDQTGPEETLTALAERILTGAQCQRCGALVQLRDGPVTAYPDVPRPDGSRWSQEDIERAGLCRWRRQGPKWEAGCTRPPEGTDTVHTTELLAQALTDLDDPRVTPLIWKARRGYYHDFLSPLATPEMQLVADLRELGLDAFAQRVIDGEFDASKAESEAWGKSEEGRSAFAALVGDRTSGAAFWEAQRAPGAMGEKRGDKGGGTC